MPIYQFNCEKCDTNKDVLCKFEDRDSKRPVCEKGDACEMKNSIQSNALKFNGGGFFSQGFSPTSAKR